ncbi:hypothetical protein GCM10009549_26060 [Streptomyces thermoalcalitolerans]|uniref:Uncharacterized protein n=1 Tax=Streptomyces thermoalcalitolerans TaxID=65605 RepID=A0ABN1NNV3_9ACTN
MLPIIGPLMPETRHARMTPTVSREGSDGMERHHRHCPRLSTGDDQYVPPLHSTDRVRPRGVRCTTGRSSASAGSGHGKGPAGARLLREGEPAGHCRAGRSGQAEQEVVLQVELEVEVELVLVQPASTTSLASE